MTSTSFERSTTTQSSSLSVYTIPSTFTPPKSCFDSTYTLDFNSDDVQSFIPGQIDYSSLNSEQCYPPGFTTTSCGPAISRKTNFDFSPPVTLSFTTCLSPARDIIWSPA